MKRNALHATMAASQLAALLAVLLWGGSAFGGEASDLDADGIPDTQDNCLIRANPAQCDTDGDFCGNRCDCDYDNNGICDLFDFGQFATAYGKSTDLEKDHTEPCTGPVAVSDFGAFFSLFGKPAGPSGTTPGTIACPLR